MDVNKKVIYFSTYNITIVFNSKMFKKFILQSMVNCCNLKEFLFLILLALKIFKNSVASLVNSEYKMLNNKNHITGKVNYRRRYEFRELFISIVEIT